MMEHMDEIVEIAVALALIGMGIAALIQNWNMNNLNRRLEDIENEFWEEVER